MISTGQLNEGRLCAASKEPRIKGRIAGEKKGTLASKNQFLTVLFTRVCFV
jgi:hypothetical protein